MKLNDIEKKIQEEINPKISLSKKGKKYVLTLEGKSDILIGMDLKTPIEKWMNAAYDFNRAVLREKFNS